MTCTLNQVSLTDRTFHITRVRVVTTNYYKTGELRITIMTESNVNWTRPKIFRKSGSIPARNGSTRNGKEVKVRSG